MALRSHAASLADGDEQGWLNGVDPGQPALVARYRAWYTTLRALGVTKFEYDPRIGPAGSKDPSVVSLKTNVWYCFGSDTCKGDGDADPPHVAQILTMKPVDGRYVITREVDDGPSDTFTPTPWQDGHLVVQKGSRVTLSAAPSEAQYLPSVLPLAEKAAAHTDAFANVLHATQLNYRIYLAGEKQWRTWYGGNKDRWVIGLATPINKYGIDVIVRVRAIPDRAMLQTTLQHELGHVVTLTGASGPPGVDVQWLAEGIAEYIGWSPQRATDSPRRSSVRWALRNGAPRSMIPSMPGRNASPRAGDAYYGLSHFAVDCMARTYGQQKLLRFTRAVLTWQEPYDEAAREAYGVPFTKVDKICVAWIHRSA
ncbi:hypothetical protein [Krasilnikovia sp. M28-CT-15]|uniref:hypothetical protein n=1 Tax=Krasilnikovia sp. M28-CT-15 TaxID=3373540 RepID=UPI0038766E28